MPDDATETLNERPQPGHRLLATCRHHVLQVTRKQVNDRGRIHTPIGKTSKLSAAAAKAKSKA